MSAYVLDSWAAMAWLRNEPAAAAVDELFQGARDGRYWLSMCLLNLGEVFYAIGRNRGLEQAERDVAILRTRIQVLPVADDLVLRAAALKAMHRISYADGFAAATAMEVGAPLVTGDPDLLMLSRALPRLQLRWLGG